MREKILNWVENRPLKIRTNRQGSFFLTLNSNTLSSSFFSCYIDWGDGSALEYKEFNTAGTATHTFANSGQKIIIIRGLNPQKVKNVAIGTYGDIILDVDFSCLVNLEKISFRYTRGAALFANGIPKELFWNYKLLTDVRSCFQEFRYAQFKSIPDDLFRFNPLLVTVASTFEDTVIETIPAGIFRYNPLVYSLNGTFRNSSINTLPLELFKYNKINSFGATFQETNLTSVPIDLFSYWEDIIYLGNTFYNCTSLTGTITLPKCLKLTTFLGFIRNTKITNVIFPDGFASESVGVDMTDWCSGNTAYNTPLNITWKITKLTFGSNGSVPIPSIRLLNPSNPFTGTSPQIDLTMCRSMTTQALTDLVNDLPVITGKTIKLPIANTTQAIIDIAVAKNWAVLTA